jgi:hypothetical protein
LSFPGLFKWLKKRADFIQAHGIGINGRHGNQSAKFLQFCANHALLLRSLAERSGEFFKQKRRMTCANPDSGGKLPETIGGYFSPIAALSKI